MVSVVSALESRAWILEAKKILSVGDIAKLFLSLFKKKKLCGQMYNQIIQRFYRVKYKRFFFPSLFVLLTVNSLG